MSSATSVNMRIRVPRGITKDQIYIAIVLGLGTGIYSWNKLLAEYVKEREKELQLNEVVEQIAPKHCVPMKSNNLLKKYKRLSLFVFGGVLCFMGFRFYMQPWLRRRKAARAEEFANFLYDQRKKRALQQSED